MGPAVLVRAALILLIFGAAVVTPTDADLWGHLAFGRDIAVSGNPVQADVYSFTSDRPWINHEWLAEVAFFAAYRLGGSIGLVVFKLGVIGTILALVWTQVRSFASHNVSWALIAAPRRVRVDAVQPALFEDLRD